MDNKIIRTFFQLFAVVTLLILSFGEAQAGVPSLLPFQGRLTDTSGTPINYTVSVKFRIYPPSGSCYIYEETQLITPNTYGVFSTLLGSLSNSTGPANSFKDVFSNYGISLSDSCLSAYVPATNDWRRIEVLVNDDPLGGMQTLGASPYALNSETLQGRLPTDFVQITGSVTQSAMQTLVSGGDASSLHNHDSLYARVDGSNTYSGNISTSADIVTTNGKIGVGTSSPSVDLELKKDSPTIRLQSNASSGGTPSFQFYSGGSTQRAKIESSESADVLKFYTGTNEALTLDASQNATFKGNVFVSGSLQVGKYTTAQEVPLATYLSGAGAAAGGTIWFNATDGVLKVWNGSAAMPVGTVSSITAGNGLTGGTITGSGTLAVDTGTSANQIVKLDSGAKLPGVDGSQLTNLSAAQIAAGTLPVSRGGTGLTALGTANQVLGVNAAGSAAEYKSISAGSGVTISHGVNSITINATGTGGTVTNVSGTSPLSVANGTTTPTVKINDGTLAGQTLRWDGSASWQATKLEYTDLVNSLAASPWPIASCGSGEVLRWISGTDSFDCVALTAADIPDLAWSKITSTPTTLAGYGITDSVSSTLANGKILVGNGSNVATAVSVTGDIALSNAGATTVSGIAGKAINGSLNTNDKILWYDQSADKVQASTLPSCSANQYLSFDGSSWSCATDVGSGGSVASLTVNSPLANSGTASNPVLDLQINSTQFDLNAGQLHLKAGGITSSELNTTGVGAGTYKSVTVDAQGRVTAGTNPTTLSGYGITDALSTTLANGKVLVGNGSNQAAAVSVSGDVSLSNAGVSTVNGISGKAINGSLSTNDKILWYDQSADQVQASTLPACSANQYLSFDGSSWTCATDVGSGGSVASLTVNAPIANSGTASNPVLDLQFNSTQFDLSSSQLHLKSGGVGTTELSTTGVGAGTYQSVTVDTKGRVTGGTNPTTLSGYNISDAVQNLGGVATLNAGLAASRPAAGTAGQIYISTDTKRIERDNGSGWDILGGATNGTVTSITAGSGLTGGTITSSGTIAVDAGTGANQIVQLDASSRLPAVDGSQLSGFTASQIPALDTSKLTSGTLGVNRGGTGLSALGSANQVLGVNAAGNAAEYKSITAGTGVTVTHGANSITIDATGSGGTVTNVSGTSPISVANNTSTPVVKIADGSSAGQTLRWNGTTTWQATKLEYTDLVNSLAASPWPSSDCTTGEVIRWVSSTDSFECVALTAADIPNLAWSKITSTPTTLAGYGITDSLSKTLANGKVLIGNGSNQATAVSVTGDIGLTNAGVSTVNGISGKAISGSLSTNDKILWYDQSSDQIAASTLPSCGANQYLSFDGSTWSCGTDAGSSGSVASLTVNAPIANSGTASNPVLDLQFNSTQFDLNSSQLHLKAGGISSTELSSTGVGAGTYQSVTVDAQGRVTAGTNPTTLSGYNISDAVQNLGGVATLKAGLAASRPASGTAGQIYISTDSKKIERDNGSSWDILGGATNGTVTSITAGTGLTGGTITSSGTIAVDVGTGANQIVQLDASSRLPAVDGSQLSGFTASQIPSLDTSKLTSGTLGVNRGGTGLSALGSANQVMGVNAAGNAAEYKTITAGTGVTVTHGANSITIDATGSGGTVTNVSGTAPISVANSASTPVVKIADGSVAGQTLRWNGTTTWQATKLEYTDLVNSLAASPWPSSDCSTGEVIRWVSSTDSFECVALTASDIPNLAWTKITSTPTTLAGYGITDAMSSTLANGKVLVGNGSNVASAVSVTGDVALTNAGVSTVNGISGKTISGSLSTNDKILWYDQSADQIAASTLPSCGANQYLSFDGSSWTCGTDAGSSGSVASLTVNAPIANSGTASNPVLDLQFNSTQFDLSSSQLHLKAGGISSTELSSTGVGAGTYQSVTVDAQGRVTAGTNPTTLSGYNISDAVKNLGGVATLNAGLAASRPAAGTAGQIYISTDSKKIERDNGSSWDVLGGATSGTVTSITAGTGLTGGTITSSGTIAVDVGTGASQIVQLDGSSRLPAVDGSQLSGFTASQIPSLDTSKLTSGTLGVARGGTGLSALGSANQVLGVNAAGSAAEYKTVTAGSGVTVTHGANSITIAATGSGGTVTSVGVSVPSYMSSSGGPITSSGSVTLGFNSQTAKYVFAAPQGASGAPTFRALNIVDILSSVSGGFLGASGACAAGQTLTYLSASDNITCQAYSITSSQISSALGYTPANGASYLPLTGGTLTGSLTAPAYYYTSDARLKYDIKQMKGLEYILKMRGVHFKWIKDDQPEIGLIAQEVEKVLPDLVHTDPVTGKKAVKYGNIVAPLIEATKDLYSMNQEQKRQIQSLESKVQSLEEQNKMIMEELKAIRESLNSRK